MRPRDTLRLLILDDEPAFCTILSRIAERAGWAPIATQDAPSFQRRFRAERPHAIVLDLHLGSEDGVEQLRFLSDEGYDGGIVVMSGFDERVLEAAREVGRSLGLAIVGLLSKPASNAEIGEHLAALAAHRRAHAAAPEPAVASAGDLEPLSVARVAQGLRAGELDLEFQPIVGATSRRVEVFEALARWRHPTRGVVMPDAFIPLTEQDDALIDSLTSWVVRTASAQAQRLSRLGVPTAVAVNISARNLRSLDFPELMVDLVAEMGLTPAAITLEITESAATGDTTLTTDILTRLRLKGFRLAMDDFGTGFSSLKALLHSPFSELKIDKSFVGRLLTSRDARLIVKSVAHLAQDLGLKTVAEGVETQATLDRLLEFGVDSFQGYHVSRAMRADRLPGWLAEWSAGRVPTDSAAR
jgi:EAL domain-containing protein (putative c-di-GMP-specific phosphodiesterase class I)/ActR/RegA family two-component response regulator